MKDKEFLNKEEIERVKKDKGFSSEDVFYNRIASYREHKTNKLLWLNNFHEKFNYIGKETDLKSIIPKKEFEKIQKLDLTSINQAINQIQPILENHKEIEGEDYFINFLKDIKVYETYLSIKKENDKLRNINKENLISIKFKSNFDYSVGITILLLNERVSPDIFKKLLKCGLDKYKEPFDCVTGWGIGDNETTELAFAKMGLRIER